VNPEGQKLRGPPGFWVGQQMHVVCVFVLLAVIYLVWDKFSRPVPAMFWLAVFVPVAHQVFVWFSWRGELLFSWVSRTIRFQGYLVIFFVLFAGRFVSLATLAWLDRGSLGLPSFYYMILTAVLVLPGLYAIYSVRRYFGLVRAAGADHFDQRYRDMPFVKQGIFKYTDDGMYQYAFLLFWAIALGFNSSAALAVAAFSHVYIWVHFYATELPDIQFLYNADDRCDA